MGIQYFGNNAKATVQGVTAQATIADIDDSTVDETYGAEEAAVLADLQTKTQTIIDQLEALGLFSAS